MLKHLYCAQSEHIPQLYVAANLADHNEVDFENSKKQLG